ncbi:MAG: S8 family serine peptidase, partial [candidate division Zixibacteria bacterium]|nr:S8 family serine peptidase [candidate division Zixibacteria bacterium]
PMNPGDYRWVTDYPYTFATPGNHTVRVVHDLTNVILESNEANNWCEYVVDVQSADPDIRVEPMSLTIEEECRGSAGALGADFEYVPPEKRMPTFNMPHHAGQLVVKFDYTKDIEPTYGAAGFRTGLESIDAICTQFNIQKARPVFRNLNRSPLLNNTYILEVTAPYSLEAAARAFFESELVEIVELNCIQTAVVVPNDPQYSSQWGLPKISMPQAWDVSNGNTSVAIAIVDTGVDWDHVDLGANIWSNPGEIPGNGIDDDGNGFVDDIRGWDFVDGAPVAPGEDGNTPDNNPDDVQGHGTHVAGIASAATNNSTGVAGVGWNCKIMPVRAGWLGTDGGGHMYSADGAAAFEYAADNGACAINYSFTSYSAGTVLSNAAQYAFNQGAVVCVAAANDDIDDPGTLGNLSTTISVAATDNSDTKASFSNYGTWVDVSAPGVSIRSTVIGDGYESWPGTSMAAPHVAGLVGLIVSVNSSLTPAQVMTIIKDN